MAKAGNLRRSDHRELLARGRSGLSLTAIIHDCPHIAEDDTRTALAMAMRR